MPDFIGDCFGARPILASLALEQTNLEARRVILEMVWVHTRGGWDPEMLPLDDWQCGPLHESLAERANPADVSNKTSTR